MDEKSRGFYQQVEFQEHVPVKIIRILGGTPGDVGWDMEGLMDHWHPELEIVCTLHGHAVHYIDGEPHTASPGAVFVVNFNSVHKILPDIESNSHYGAGEVIAIVVQIDRRFLMNLMPELENMRFLPEVQEDKEEVGKLIVRMEQEFPEGYEPTRYKWFHLMSFTDEMLYRLCCQRLVQKDVILPINREKNLERLKGIMTWVEEHYQEPIVQREVAEKFYFTPEYFSRFFHRNTGITFGKYVAVIRCRKAREELLSSGRSVMDIALDCGFSDSRGLINRFRSVYGTTPNQYRKANHVQ